MQPITDGRYEVFILHAAIVDQNTMSIEMTMVSGDDKGAVVALRGPHLARDPVSLLGLPATLVVDAGVPRVVLDD